MKLFSLEGIILILVGIYVTYYFIFYLITVNKIINSENTPIYKLKKGDVIKVMTLQGHFYFAQIVENLENEGALRYFLMGNDFGLLPWHPVKKRNYTNSIFSYHKSKIKLKNG